MHVSLVLLASLLTILGANLLNWVLVGGVTLASPYVLQALKKLSTWIGGLSTWPMRVALFVVTLVLTSLGQWLGLPLPADLAGWTGLTVSSFLSAVLGHFAYQLFPSAAALSNAAPPAPPATPVPTPTVSADKTKA